MFTIKLENDWLTPALGFTGKNENLFWPLGLNSKMH